MRNSRLRFERYRRSSASDVGASIVVQRQLDAYNAHDLAAFVAAYSDAVQIFRMPATQPAITGKAQLAAFYATHRFNVPRTAC